MFTLWTKLVHVCTMYDLRVSDDKDMKVSLVASGKIRN